MKSGSYSQYWLPAISFPEFLFFQGREEERPGREVEISTSLLMTHRAFFPNKTGLVDEPKGGNIFAWSDFCELPW